MPIWAYKNADIERRERNGEMKGWGASPHVEACKIRLAHTDSQPKEDGAVKPSILIG